MRHAPLLALLALAAACSKSPPPPEPSAAPREHPLAQDGTAARGITSLPDRAKIELDLGIVRAAVRAYRAEKNGWPASIAELAIEGLNYPADLSYDPATGTVTSQTYPTY